MSIKNGVLGDGSFALLAMLVVTLASETVAIAAVQPVTPQFGTLPMSAEGFDNKPFEQNFLDRFGSFGDGQFNHAPVGMTVPGPAAILTAGLGLLMISGRRRPL